MRIRRVLPPAATSIYLKDLTHGLLAVFSKEKYRKRLEDELKEFFNVKHIFLVSSGKAALVVILLALRSLVPKDKVLVPAYTCFSVPSAILKAGLEIALCDIDPSTYDFDYELLEAELDEETLCIIPNHLFGIPSDMDRLLFLSGRRKILVVEDAAQAMGVEHNNKKLGCYGDVGFFSLGRGKNVTCGSGGVIVTNSDPIGKAIRKIYAKLPAETQLSAISNFFQVFCMSLFMRPSFYWLPDGLPFLELGKTVFSTVFPVHKMDYIKMGLLHNWKSRLEEANKIRALNARELIRKLRLRQFEKRDCPYLRLPVVVESPERRDQLFGISRTRGLGLSRMYPTAVHEIELLKGSFSKKKFPVASAVAQRILAIPTHPFLSIRDQMNICRLLEQDVLSADNFTSLFPEGAREAYHHN